MQKKKSSKKKGRPTDVTGIVVASKWDEKGNPIEKMISTDQEIELIIDNRNKKGEELQNHMHRKVQVIGRAEKISDQRTMITVKSYTLLDEMDAWEFGDDMERSTEAPLFFFLLFIFLQFIGFAYVRLVIA